jgi:GAF domain-containing protein
MLKRIRGWLQAPYYADPDQQRRAGYVNTILLTAVVLVLLVIGLRSWGGWLYSTENMLLLGLAAVVIFLRWLLGRGFLTLVSYLLVLTIAGGLTAIAWGADGIHDVTFFASLLAVLVAALLIGWQGSAVVLAFTMAAGWIMALAESTGRLSPRLDTATNFARDYTAVLIMFGLLIFFLRRSLESATEDAQASAAAAHASNVELEALRDELALRVELRTAELEHSRALANRRVEQLQAVSDVAGAIASVQGLDELLGRVTQLISSQFHYYHSGIFLIDEARKYAELRAANSEGGLRMLARQHRLRMDGAGIVPNVASTGQPRITLEVSEDAFFLKNPDLPETRSEMSLPLMVSDKIIGVLDVQSTEPNAFGQEDIDVLLTLANQVAIAIENARLFGETREALQSAESASRGFLRQEWSRFSRRLEVIGAHFDGRVVEPIYSVGASAAGSSDSGLVVPIMLHGDVVGELAVGGAAQKDSWSADELAVLRATAERVAVALENARLLEETSTRAERERTVAEITNKIRATNDPQAMIETALRELKEALGASKVALLPPNGTSRADQSGH